MVTLEQVEKLRERTGISYEEAKQVLEEVSGDVLEAVILLEKRQQIVPPAGGGYYHTGQGEGQQHQQHQPYQHQQHHHQQKGASGSGEGDRPKGGTTFGEAVGNFFRWCGKVIHKGNSNGFRVLRGEEKIMVIPLTAMVLLLIFAFWIIIPLIVIGLFFGYRYRFEGPDLGKPAVNKAMDSVADAAENFKNDVTGQKGQTGQTGETNETGQSSQTNEADRSDQ